MTLTRNQLLLVILVVVVACGVGLAVYYVEHVYKEREKGIDLVKQGRTEELIKPGPPKPPGPPPLERSTTRGTEVLVVMPAPGGTASAPASPRARFGKIASIRGNGEFVRLPSLPGEAGPLVTGLLDRAQVDDLIRSIQTPAAGAEGGDVGVIALPSGEPGSGMKIWNRKAAAPILEMTGRSTNRTAVPERVRLFTAVAEPGATATAWPFELNPPEAFERGGMLFPTSDKSRYRDGLLKLLAPDARFSSKGRIWRIAEIDLIP